MNTSLWMQQGYLSQIVSQQAEKQYYCFMQKKSVQSSLLRQTRVSVNMSRTSEHLNPNLSILSTSFDFDNSFNDTSYEQIYAQPTSLRTKIVERKNQQRQRLNQAKLNYLTKVLTNKMINARLALKKMEELPRALFRKGPSLDIAEALILKSKISLETSLIRSLFYSSDIKKKNQCKLKLERGLNTIVTATPTNNYVQEREGIFVLNELLKNNLRFCIRQFVKNHQTTKVVQRYLSKICSNHHYNRQLAFQKIKRLPNKGKRGGIDRTTFLLQQTLSILNKIKDKQMSLQLQAFQAIKVESWKINFTQKYAVKNMITFSRIKKEQAFQLWRQDAHEFKQKQQLKAKIEEQKLQALRRIVKRNYLKLFKEISRRIFTFRKAARYLGCYSKLNEQKSLWRLVINLNGKSNLS